jgi:hypothetical protein
MTEAIVKQDSSSVALAVSEFKDRMQFEGQRLQLMREFVAGQMAVGTHYGKIPGTNGKMTLLKAGAELLTNIHGLHPEFVETERVSDRTAIKQWKDKYNKDRTITGLVKYSFRCSLIKGEAKVGEGVGTCNNWERKYLSVDPDDAENTVMKMAKKRAFIDAVLTATRTSDFFTQDMEEAAPAPEGDRQPPDGPGASDGPEPEPTHSSDVISEPQRRRLFAISKAAQKSQGWDDERLKKVMDDLLLQRGYNSSKDIKRKDYEAICTEVEAWK